MEFEKLPRSSQNLLNYNNSDNNNQNNTKQRRLLNDMRNMHSYNAYQSFKPVRTSDIVSQVIQGYLTRGCYNSHIV